MSYAKLASLRLWPATAFEKSPVTIIQREDQTRSDLINDLWKYHELLFCLVRREIQVRYRQTVLGAAWAILQPLSLVIVFTLFVRRAANETTSGVPYSLFVFTGLLPWTLFGSAVSAGGQSVVRQQNLITKIFFPRLILPMSAVGIALVDFAVAFVIVPLMMTYHGALPGWGFWILPISLIGLTAAALGIGALLASLTVAYRDFQFVIPFMVQLWMFATPGIYLQGEFSPRASRWHSLLALNPAQGLIVNFRAALLNLEPDYLSLGISLAVSFGLLLVGCVFFHRQERSFADIV